MKNKTIPHCTLPWTYLYLRYGGRIQPCCQNSTSLGNVNVEGFNFDKVWNGKEMQLLRKLISEDKYEEAGCSKDCNIIHTLKHEKGVQLFDSQIIAVAKLNNNFKNNLYKLKKAISEKKVISSNLPTQLDIQPTEACNMSCIMCHQNHTNPDKLGTKEILKVIEPIIETIYSISFQGGEIFIDKKYKELLINLKHRIQKFQQLKVITNGSLLFPEDLDKMTKGENPIYFTISADGVNEKTFKEIRQSSHFNRVIKNIRYLAKVQENKKKEIIRWNFVVMKSNFYQIKELIILSSQLKITIFLQAIIGTYPEENIFQYLLIDIGKALKYIQEAIILQVDLKAKIIGLEILKQKLESNKR